jgi:hypothetical protein
MSPDQKVDDAVVGIELDCNGMPANVDHPQEELPGGSTAPKYDQNKLAVVYTNNSDTPSQDDPLPSTERLPNDDSRAAEAPPLALPVPLPAPTPTANPLAPDNNASGPVDDNADFLKQQYATFCQAQELKQQATALKHPTYQSAASQIQTLLSTLRTRKDSISIDDLDMVHESFDFFMSSHPVLSKGFIEAKMAQQAAMLQMQGLMGAAAMPAGGRVASPTQIPPIERKSLINNVNLDNYPYTSLLDPSNPYLQGGTAPNGGGGVVGRLDLLQDVAAAYRYHMMQSSQTNSAGDLYINALRNYLLDKANIDSSAVEALQQLSADRCGGWGSANSGGRNGRGGKRSRDADDDFSDKLRQNPRRRVPSCKDLARSALLSLGESQQEKYKPGPSGRSSEMEKDRSRDADKKS